MRQFHHVTTKEMDQHEGASGKPIDGLNASFLMEFQLLIKFELQYVQYLYFLQHTEEYRQPT